MGTGEGASGFVVEGNFIGTGLGIADGNAGHGIALADWAATIELVVQALVRAT